jgi:putative phosphoesterase
VVVRIGLVSDVHATPGPLREALAIFEREGVERILCGGDIAGYGEELDETVALLRQSRCESIVGNHDQWCLQEAGDEVNSATLQYLRDLPLARRFTLEGRRLYMVHASPPDSTMDGIRLLDEDGEVMPAQVAMWSERLAHFGYDVLLVGHTHQIFAERLGETLVINPGSSTFNHSCAVLTLPQCELQLYGLSGYEPSRTWNWGANQIYGTPRG